MGNHADRQLLFGLLALQNGLVLRKQLVASFENWINAKSSGLDELLVKDGAITEESRNALKHLVNDYLQSHNGDTQQGLHALTSIDLAVAKAELQQIADYDLTQPIAKLPTDPYATAPHETEEVSVNGSDSDSRNTDRASRFRIVRPLEGAKGGMGVISVAEDEELGRQVALKQIRADHADNSVYRSKFQLEAEVTGNLEHPGIVPIYGLGKDSTGRPYYAMRLVQGENLNHAISEFHQSCNERKPEYDSVKFHGLIDRLIDVGQAVSYAHSRCVIHRDIKPDNVLVGRFGETLLIDWGLARLPASTSPSESFEHNLFGERDAPLLRGGNTTDRTEQGSVMGTLGYAPPEQVQGRIEDVGVVSDVYALGAILYQILTSRTPIQTLDRSFNSILDDTLRGVIAPPTERISTIPKPLSAICMKALSREPTNRYQSADLFVAELERWKADLPIAARRETFVERVTRLSRRHRAAALASASALAAVAIVSIVALVGVNYLRQVAEDSATSERIARIDESKAKDKANRLAFLERQAREEVTKQKQVSDMRLYANKIRLAQTEWEFGDGALALQTLDSCRWDLRSWEYDYLHTQFEGKSGNTLYGHSGRVTSVAVSPDGTRIVSGSNDGTLRVWSVETGEELLLLGGLIGPVAKVAFSPNGNEVSCSDHNTVTVWNSRTGEELLSVENGGSLFTDYAYSPDGGEIATSGSIPGSVAVLNAVNGETKLRLEWPKDLRAGPPLSIVESIAFSPDGTHIGAGSDEGVMQFWETSTGQASLRINAHSAAVEAIGFSLDGSRLVSCSEDTLKVWDARTGEETLTIPGDGEWFSSPAFSLDGQQVVAGIGSAVKVWNITSGQVELTLKGHRVSVDCLARSADGLMIVSGGGDNLVKIWNMESKDEHILRLMGHHGGVSGVALSGDGSRIVSCSAVDGTLRLWDSSSGAELVRLDAYTENARPGVNCVAINQSGTRLVSGGNNGSVNIWDAESGEVLLTLDGHTGDIFCTLFTSDYRNVVTCSTPWNGVPGSEDGLENLEFTTNDGLNDSKAIAIAPILDPSIGQQASAQGDTLPTDGEQVELSPGIPVAPVLDPSIEPSGDTIFDAADIGGRMQTTDSNNHNGNKKAIEGVEDGPNDHQTDLYRLPDPIGDCLIKIWDAQTGREKRSLEGPDNGLYCLVASRDGSTIVGGGEEIIVWDSRTGNRLHEIESPATSLAISPDGKQLVSADEDLYILNVWDVSTAKKLMTLHTHSSVTTLAFSPDSRRIISGSADSTIMIWDVKTGERILTLNGEGNPISCLAVSADGTRIANGSAPYAFGSGPGELAPRQPVTVRCAKRQERELTLASPSHWDIPAVYCVATTSDASSIVSLDSDSSVLIYDAKTGQETHRLDPFLSTATCVDTDSVGSLVVIGTNDLPEFSRNRDNVQVTRDESNGPDINNLSIWEPTTGNVRTFYGHRGGVNSAVINSDGTLIVSGGTDGLVKVWNIATGELEVALAGHSGAVRGIALSENGRYIVSGGSDNLVKVWTVTGDELFSIEGHTEHIYGVAFSPDGKRIASVGDATVKVWDAQTGNELLSLDSHTQDVRCVTYSPDGTIIASGSFDNSIRIWDAKSGELLQVLTGHTNSVGSLGFLGSREQIVSCSDDNTVKLWSLSKKAL